MEHIKIKGNLTPSFINNRLSPFLDSLTGIQNIINEIKQDAPSNVRIHEISWDGGGDENELWTRKSGSSISLDEAKQALAGLREAIEALYEQPDNLLVKRAKAQIVKSYTEFIHGTLLKDFTETEPETFHISVFSGSPVVKARVFRSSAIRSSNILLDTLDNLDSLENTQQELSHIIGLLKGEDND